MHLAKCDKLVNPNWVECFDFLCCRCVIPNLSPTFVSRICQKSMLLLTIATKFNSFVGCGHVDAVDVTFHLECSIRLLLTTIIFPFCHWSDTSIVWIRVINSETVTLTNVRYVLKAAYLLAHMNEVLILNSLSCHCAEEPRIECSLSMIANFNNRNHLFPYSRLMNLCVISQLLQLQLSRLRYRHR